MENKDHRPLPQAIQDRGVSSISDRLKGCRIGYGVSGGIASIEAIKIIREFRRHGASVFPFMTPDAQRFITPLALEWAANHTVVEAPSAQVEYLERFDLVVVAPATLNTISKVAHGLTDSSVSLLAASQLGARGKIVFVPTMNDSLRNFPGYLKSRNQLKEWGALFLDGDEEEGRLKIPVPEKVVEFCLELFL